MKQPKKKDLGNLLFSAFLVTAFLVCAYFLIGLINNSFTENEPLRRFLTAGLFSLFGLLLFYATRVGDGKQVWRFSPVTLIVMVLPALYIVLTSVISALPLHTEIGSRTELLYLAGAALGYGIPYTFLSGYELDTSDNPPSETPETEQENNETAEQENNKAPEQESTEAPEQENTEALEQENNETAELENNETVEQENNEAPEQENDEAPEQENTEAPEQENSENS